MDGPYIFPMLLAFSGIFKIMLSHCGSVSPLVQPSKIDTSESKIWTLTKGMNEVSIHISHIFGNKQNLLLRKTYQKTEELGYKRGQIEGPTKTREATLTHGN